MIESNNPGLTTTTQGKITICGKRETLEEHSIQSTSSGLQNTSEELYRPIERAIEKIRLGYSHLCFIRGQPGIGKSSQIRLSLKRFGMKYHEVCGDVSEAYLYRMLHENRSSTIWFKDIARLLKSPRNLDLLKSACESDETRIVTNHNYGHHCADLPKSFHFNGNIIFDFNSLHGLKAREDFEALITRGDFVDLVFGPEDISAILKSIAESDQERKITEFLLTNEIIRASGQLNLRTQKRAFLTAEYAAKIGNDWREEILQDFESKESDAQRLLRPLLGNRPLRTSDLKRQLVKRGLVNTIRTAERRIAEWIELGELFRAGDGFRNFLVSLRPTPFPF